MEVHGEGVSDEGDPRGGEPVLGWPGDEIEAQGPEHDEVVVEKLAAMHAVEPAYRAGNLGQVLERTLVLIGDDDEVRFEHAIEAYTHIPKQSSRSCPGPHTAARGEIRPLQSTTFSLTTRSRPSPQLN